jgi:hypothetical protein
MVESESSALNAIGKNARALRKLEARIKDTFACRGDSPAGRVDWERACAEFHGNYADLAFPGGIAVLPALGRGDTKAVEAASLFLAADPWFFRSGYLKEYLWRRLKHQTLSDAQLKRLESAGIGYVKRRCSVSSGAC